MGDVTNLVKSTMAFGCSSDPNWSATKYVTLPYAPCFKPITKLTPEMLDAAILYTKDDQGRITSEGYQAVKERFALALAKSDLFIKKGDRREVKSTFDAFEAQYTAQVAGSK
jgi:hypothetical protein